VLEAEVRCYHCGRQVGTVRLRQRPHQTDPILNVGGATLMLPQRLLVNVRCLVCGGPTYLDDMQTRYELPPEAYEPAPPGRPRKGGREVA
jgi:hypothetical protein